MRIDIGLVTMICLFYIITNVCRKMIVTAVQDFGLYIRSKGFLVEMLCCPGSKNAFESSIAITVYSNGNLQKEFNFFYVSSNFCYY